MVSDSGARGLLSRGWSPSPRVSATVFIVVGVLLMIHPVVGGLPDAVGLTGNAEYSAAEISPDGGDVEFQWLADVDRSVVGLLSQHGGLTLVDCLPNNRELAYCGLESSLTNGTATVDLPASLWGGYTYHGRFYERVVVGQTGGTTVSLQPVDAETVLTNVSIPARDWSDQLRRAVDEGQVTADPRLSSTGAVLSRDGQYYVVLPTSSVPRDEPAGPLYTAFFTATGLLLIQRGRERYRDYRERQSVRNE